MSKFALLGASAALSLSACATGQVGPSAQQTAVSAKTTRHCPAVMATSVPYMNGQAILTIVPQSDGVLLIRIAAENFAEHEFYGFDLGAFRRSAEPARDGIISFFDWREPPITLKRTATRDPADERPTSDVWEATLELAVFANEPIQFSGSTRWTAEPLPFDADEGYTATHLSIGPKSDCTFEDLNLEDIMDDDASEARLNADRRVK